MSGHELLTLIAPELVLLAGGCVVLLVGLTRLERARFISGWVSLGAILAALVIAWNVTPEDRTGLGMRIGDLVW
jgi:hypothetical protein